MADPFANDATRVDSRVPPIQMTIRPQEEPVKVQVPTSGGGFTNIEMPLSQYEYLKDQEEGNQDWKSQPLANVRRQLWQSPEAIEMAKKQQPERYADPINNTLNNLMFGGAGVYKAVANGAVKPIIETVREWGPKLSFRSAYGNTSLATAGDAVMTAVPTGHGINDMVQNGPTAENVAETALGLTGLGFDAAPTFIEGYNTVRRTINPFTFTSTPTHYELPLNVGWGA